MKNAITILVGLACLATAASAETMYAVTGTGGRSSTLFVIDKASGTVDHEVGPTGRSHITGMDVNPVTGLMYATANRPVPPEERPSRRSTLLIVDRTTGTAYPIASIDFSFSDLAFDDAGALHGRAINSPDTDLVYDILSISTSSGATALVNSFGGLAGTGIAFDGIGRLLIKSGRDGLTWAAGPPSAPVVFLGSVTPIMRYDNALAYSVDDGTMYTIERIGGSEIYRFDPGTLAASFVGVAAPAGIAALAITRPGTPESVRLQAEQVFFETMTRMNVEIFSSDAFDAPQDVDPASLTFGRTGGEASLIDCPVVRDLDGDGRDDLRCSVDSVATGLPCGAAYGILMGRLFDGTPISGVAGVADPFVDPGDASCEPLFASIDSLTADRMRSGVRLRWTTSSEIDNIGFRVLRATSAKSAPVVVSGLIPARGNALSGADYEFEDALLRPLPSAATYWIEDIDVFGRTTRHGPVTVVLRHGTRTARSER